MAFGLKSPRILHSSAKVTNFRYVSPYFVLAALQGKSNLFLSVKSIPNRKKQHARQAENERGVRVSKGKRLAVIVSGVLLLGIIAFAGAHYLSQSRTEAPNITTGSALTAQAENAKQPKTLAELVVLKPENLAAVDIGLMNMLCAEGLSGAEDMKIADCQATLDQWAQRVKSETDRNFHRFREDPAYFYNSESFYKMVMMAVVVYEDFGIRYNPKWIN
jgi:hypothetical protein